MISGITSSSTTRIVQIEKIATAAMGSSSIVFSNIPQTYDSLLIRGDLALSTNISGFVESYPATRFNDDAGTNYSRAILGAVTNNGQQNATSMDIGVPGPNSLPWVRTTQLEIYIPDYANTSKYKSLFVVMSRTVTNANSGTDCERVMYQWRSTSAINKWSITTGGGGGSPTGNFLAEGNLVMYGLRIR